MSKGSETTDGDSGADQRTSERERLEPYSIWVPEPNGYKWRVSRASTPRR